MKPVPGLARQTHEALGQIVDGHAAPQLVSLKLGQRVIGRVDVGEALAQLDREFDAADVTKPAVRQAGPALMPVLVFSAHGGFQRGGGLRPPPGFNDLRHANRPRKG